VKQAPVQAMSVCFQEGFPALTMTIGKAREGVVLVSALQPVCESHRCRCASDKHKFLVASASLQ